MREQADGDTKPPAGALLSDDQIKRLKVAIAVMSALLVVGIVTLIARVVYLASGRTEQAPITAPVAGAMQAELKLALPAGAALKAATLQGSRILAHYSAPRGDGLIVLDLVSGRTISHIRIEAQP